MKEEMKREIRQLWKAADKYFSLALEEEKGMNKSDMDLTIDDLTKDDAISSLNNYDNIFFLCNFNQ